MPDDLNKRSDSDSRGGPTPAASPERSLECLQWQRRNSEKIANYCFLLILLVAGILFYRMIKVFLVPVILAAVFAGLFYPFYTRVVQWARGQRSLGALICCLALSLGLLLPAYAVAHLGTREAARLYQKADPAGNGMFIGDFQVKLQSHPLVRKLPITFEHLAKKAAEVLSGAVDAASRETLGLIATLSISFFTMFYFFRDGPRLLAKLKFYSPLADDDEDELIRRFLSVSRATLKGTLLVSLIKGVLGGLTFWAFGIQGPVLWGVVMTFLSVLPIVGPWLVMYPAALFVALSGHVWQGIAIFVIASLILGVVDNWLQPKIIGRDSGMHELLVFFSTLGGIIPFGVMGFVVGPVIAALFFTLLEMYGREFNSQLTQVHRRHSKEQPEVLQSPGSKR
jgi:predicted PurR-regulated permease PerM